MRILFVADGRSPTALSWIEHFVREGHDVHLASTYPAWPELALASLRVVPVAFSRAAGSAATGQTGSGLKSLVPVALRARLRNLLGPFTLKKAATQLSAVIDEVQPDLLHALRIPYEGMLVAAADPPVPLVVSVWGNDFTLHARSNPLMAGLTRQAMSRADALMADCRRDIRLAQRYGFPAERPHAVLPGAGGLHLDLFYPPENPVKSRVAVNPRGMRGYIRNDTFFKAAARVLAELPEARFLCPAMAGDPEAERWVSRLGIGAAVKLLPRQSREEIAALFRRSAVVVSPSEHDGTPNSLLEGMACGCFPVAGDIESIREWIADGHNGLLADPADPADLAAAILRGFRDSGLRARAQAINTRLVAEQAEYGAVMAQAEGFYRKVVG